MTRSTEQIHRNSPLSENLNRHTGTFDKIKRKRYNLASFEKNLNNSK